MRLVSATGEFLIGTAEAAGRGVVLILRAFAELPYAFQMRSLRRIVQQLFLCGVAALPVVTITALFSGMVISGQTGAEMRRAFGSVLFLGSLGGAAMVREMGPVLGAVMLAGLVGGGMASVLGTMKVSEEVDALETMSIAPIRYLVMPRLAAMMIATPLLIVFADLVGIWGGAVVAKHTLGVDYAEFYRDCWDALLRRDIYFGLLKAEIFGIIITGVACAQGLSAKGGAEGVGRATMRSVVYSFLLILIANYVLFGLIYRPFMIGE